MKKVFWLILIVCFFCITTTVQAKQIKKVVFTPHEPTFKHQERVTIPLRNMTNDQEFSYYVVRAEQKDGDVWKQIRSDIGCPCQAECKKGPTLLASRRTRPIHWDQKDDQCAYVKPGTYRLNVKFVAFEQPSGSFVIE
jgi:hypothetical protein